MKNIIIQYFLKLSERTMLTMLPTAQPFAG